MRINPAYIHEYERLMRTTGMQKGYQELIKTFRALRTHLASGMPGYKFTGSIVENNMDYSYFQFTDDGLRSQGLKFVVVFVHKEFAYEIWLSGMNRKVQADYHRALSKAKHLFALSPDPQRCDYILKDKLIDGIDYVHCEESFEVIRGNAAAFVRKVRKLV
jgi:hypothetical protein